jgi:hypothetical protein
MKAIRLPPFMGNLRWFQLAMMRAKVRAAGPNPEECSLVIGAFQGGALVSQYPWFAGLPCSRYLRVMSGMLQSLYLPDL